MFDEQIERIKSKIELLRRHDPQGAVLFGAIEHQYRLNPVASEDLLQCFEAKHNLTLPIGFRQFLLHVGNGGAGPYYGLHRLAVAREEDFAKADKVIYKDGRFGGYIYNANHPEFNAIHRCRFSSLPEYTENGESDHSTPADDDYWQGMKETALVIGAQGCSIATLLVVDGPVSGQIWSVDREGMSDARYGFRPEVPENVHATLKESQSRTRIGHVAVYGINPFGQNGVNGVAFWDWYEHWLNAGLKFLEIEIQD